MEIGKRVFGTFTERLETENAWRSRVRDVLAARATEAANRRDARCIGSERHVRTIDARAF